MRPVVGLGVSHHRMDLFYPLRDMGLTPLLFRHIDPHRYQALRDRVGLRRIVCVLDDDPHAVMHATSLGMDGVIWDQPDNRYFSWHLRALDVDDALRGIGRLLSQWRERVAKE